MGTALTVTNVGYLLGTRMLQYIVPEGRLVELRHLIKGKGEIFFKLLRLTCVQINKLVIPGVSISTRIIQPQVDAFVDQSEAD